MSGKNFVKIILVSSLVFTALMLPFSNSVKAAEQVDAGIIDTAVAVDVIVSIDKDTRVITLKNEVGEYYIYTAGPEVKNFDQLKRGDLVLLQYYSGFAFDLKPKGSGLEEKASAMSVQTAKPGEKPGMKVTGGTFIAAEIIGIDRNNEVLILEGPDHALALKVNEEINLDNIDVGQEVDVLYVESYAVSVVPAPKVSGTLKMQTKAVAVGIGVSWGEGTFTMYDGSQHEFTIRGLTVADVGITTVKATGKVYNLVEAKDLEGIYAAGEAGATFVGGGSVLALQNDNYVVMKLQTAQKGVRLSLAGQGLKVKLK